METQDLMAEHPAQRWPHSWLGTVLIAVHAIGLLVALLTFMYDLRLPIEGYQLFVAAQVFALYSQICRRNYLTFVFGFCLTSMLFLASLIESATYLPYDGYLIADAYRPEIVMRAYQVLLGTASLFHLVSALLSPRRVWEWSAPSDAERYVGRRSILPLLVLSAILYGLTLSGLSIAEEPYAVASSTGPLGGEIAAGLMLLATFFLCLALVGSVRDGGYMSRQYVAVLVWVVASIFYFRLLRGSRSDSIMVFATILLLFLMHSRMKEWVKLTSALFFSGLILILFHAWVVVRTTAADEGLVETLAIGLLQQADLVSEAAFTPFAIQLLPSSYWQLLHTIDLYDVDRIQLGGKTFLDLVPQVVPNLLAKTLGFERPVEAGVGYLLARYRDHGGGMYIIAEGYWNLGLCGAFAVAGAMAVISVLAERWFRRRPPLVASAYFGFLGTFGFGIFYGLQAFVRALEVGVAIAAVYLIIVKHIERQRERTRKVYVGDAI